VTARYAGDGSFQGSTSSDLSLTVQKAPLTVLAVSTSKVYGQDNPGFSVLYSAFRNGDTAASLGGSLGFSTQATRGSPVGTYAVTPAGLTSDNYAITFQAGTLTVNRKALIVTADDKGMVYGQAVPALTVGYNGFVNGDDPSVLSGTVNLSTAATSSSDVGSYAISIS